MKQSSTSTLTMIDHGLTAQAPLARRAPSPQLRVRTLRALEHAARESASATKSSVATFNLRDGRRALAAALGIAAIVTLALVNTLHVPSAAPSRAIPATITAQAGHSLDDESAPAALVAALPHETSRLVASVTTRVVEADDPLQREAQALRQDFSRALAHLRDSDLAASILR